MRILFIILLIALMPSVAKAQNNILCSVLEDKGAYNDNKSVRYLVEGPDGWVFRTLSDLKQDYKLSEKRLESFKKFSDLLEKKGVKLHLVMQPARGISHFSKIPYDSKFVDFKPKEALESYKYSIQQLKNAGLSVTDFSDYAPTEDEDFYYKLDSHWNSSGAKRTAQKTTDAIKNNGFKYSKNKNYVTESVGIQGKGYNGIEKFIIKKCDLDLPRPRREFFKTYETGVSESDLFGDSQNVEFALAGTSNMAEPYSTFANYTGFLRQDLSADVDNFSIEAGGVESALMHVLNTDGYKNGQYKNLIWEVSSHYNFNGKKVGDIFRQIIPATQGFCDGNELFKTTYEFGESKKPIFDASLLENPPLISGLNRYMTFKFSDKIKKDFMVMIAYDDDTTDRFRFWRAERYPHDGIYFLSLDRENDAKIKSIKILTDDDFVAYDLNLQVCSY